MGSYEEELAARLRKVDDELKTNSFSPNLLVYKGFLLGLGKRDTEALYCFEMALLISPGYSYAYEFRSRFYYDRFKYDPALEDIDRAIELTKSDPDRYFLKGKILRKLREPEKAIAEYTWAITLKPNYQEALFERGYLYRDLGEKEKAEADLTLAKAMEQRERKTDGRLLGNGTTL